MNTWEKKRQIEDILNYIYFLQRKVLLIHKQNKKYSRIYLQLTSPYFGLSNPRIYGRKVNPKTR